MTDFDGLVENVCDEEYPTNEISFALTESNTSNNSLCRHNRKLVNRKSSVSIKSGNKKPIILTFCIFCLSMVPIFTFLFILPLKIHILAEKSNLSTFKENISREDCDINFPWKGVRLPKKFIPLQYNLSIHPKWDSDEFSGSIIIDFTINMLENLNLTNWLILHAKNLTINRWKFLDKISNRLEKMECRKFDQFALKLPENFLMNIIQNFSIEIEFHGNYSKELDGLYISNYIDGDEHTKKSIVTTHFEPVSARKMIPCLDEPSFKAVFIVSIFRPINMISLSNAALQKSVKLIDYNDSMVLDTFEPTLKMSTYLLALVVCDYKSVSDRTRSGTLVSIYAPQFQLSQASFALTIAVRALEYFETYFNIPYPMSKIDLITISDFKAGAMENWGLVTFRDVYILYDREKSSLISQEWVATVVVHELSHQWFGNLATMKWWNDLWLNEGFANFMENFVTDDLEPSWNLRSAYVADPFENALALDGLYSTHPVSNIADLDVADIESSFDEITYDKGSSLIRSLSSIVSPDVFRTALYDYLLQHRYSNADKNDLWAALNRHLSKLDTANVSMVDFMNSFTSQSGYPLIEISSFENGTFLMNQSRFFYLRDFFLAENNSALWFVPLTVKFSGHVLNRTFWMKQEKQISIDTGFKTTPQKWYLVNINKTGFYRINYPIDNWLALIDEITSLSTEERIGLLTDAFALVELGKLPINILFDLMTAMIGKNERSRGVWATLSQTFMSLEHLLRESNIYETYRKFVAHLIKPVYEKADWTFWMWNATTNVRATHEQVIVQLAILRLACSFNVGDCRQKASAQFSAFLDSNQSLSVDLRLLTCAYWLKSNPENGFDRVLSLYNTSLVPGEKSDYLSCLSFTGLAWQLNKFLELSIEQFTVRSSQTAKVFWTIADNYPGGEFMVWRFMTKNFDRLIDYVSLNMLSKFVKICSIFRTKYDYGQFTTFFGTKSLGSARQAYQQTKERILINIQFLSFNNETMIRYFEEKKPTLFYIM